MEKLSIFYFRFADFDVLHDFKTSIAWCLLGGMFVVDNLFLFELHIFFVAYGLQ
jgi:hypothetical protein